MAIFFPPESPIKWFKWAKRNTDAAEYEAQAVDVHDEGHFQFWDTAFANHRVVALDDAFVFVAELSGDSLGIVTVGSKSVYTIKIPWGSHYVENDIAYLAVIDSNDNFNLSNYLPNGSFDTAENWTLDAGMTISGGGLVFAGTDLTADADYNLPLKTTVEYTVTVTFTNVIISGIGVITVRILNGAGIEAATSPASSGSLSATFTTDSADLTIQVESVGNASIIITEVAATMSGADATPQWVSAPFCVDDYGTLDLVHCCAVNNYFNTFYATTGYVPRLRINGQLSDIPPDQDVEQFISTSGNIVNYFVQNVTQQELRVDWFPAYLVNFFSILFYMDNSALNNVAYRAIEPPEFNGDEQAPDIQQMAVRIGREALAAGFKQIITDPTTADCDVLSGAYISQNDGTEYQSQNNSELYYPQQ